MRPPSLPAGSLPDGLKRQMLNWAWAELCSSRVWQYSMMLAHTWAQRTTPLRSLTVGLVMNNNDYAYKTRHTLFQCHIIQFSEFPLSILLLEEVYFITSLEENYTHTPFIRELFVTPVALPPPSLLVCLLSLQVQRSQPALATSPSHSQPDDQAGTDTGAKKEKKRDILPTAIFTLGWMLINREDNNNNP